MKKQLLSLVALFVALAAVSCGPAQENDPKNPGDASSSPESSGEAEESSVEYDIPEPELPALDYGGEDYTIYTTFQDNESTEDRLFPPAKYLFSESLTGEIVNDTVFKRNLAVEEKFHIKINVVQNDTDADTLIVAGEPFDLVADYANFAAERVYTGAYLNMYDFPYLSLDAEYWSPRAIEGTRVDDLVYFMPCDVSMDHLSNTGFLYFNKRILAEHDLENPYDLVHDNNWTLDTFLSMVKQVHGDLNGDGAMDMNDLYGCLHKGQWGDAFFFQMYYGAGQTFTKWDPDNGRVLNFNAEAGEHIIQTLWGVLEDKTMCMSDLEIERLTNTSHWENQLYRVMFAEGHSLFVQDYISAMDTFREMQDDFGLVPNPKYDTNQKEYYHRVRPHFAAFLLPVTLQNEEKTGAVLDYWAWYSHYTLLPAYYEITIKQKRIRDEDAFEMLDIIRTTQTFEFGELYYTHIPHYAWDAWEYHSFTNRVIASEKFLAKRLAKYVKMLRSVSD